MSGPVRETWEIVSPYGDVLRMTIDPDNLEDGAFLLRHIRYLLERRDYGNHVPVQINGVTVEKP